MVCCCLALSAIDDTTLERKGITVLMLIFTSSEPLKFSEAQQNSHDLIAQGCPKNDTQYGSKLKKVWQSDDNIYMQYLHDGDRKMDINSPH
jgi:hypothetical protein